MHGDEPDPELLLLLQQLQSGEAAGVEEQLALCRRALELVSRDTHPQVWAALQAQLGLGLARFGSGDPQDREQAIQSLSGALEVFTREDTVQWALAHKCLGDVYADQTADAERALVCYERGLEATDLLERRPSLWAGLQHARGSVYHERVLGDRQGNLERAIACFEAALPHQPEGSVEQAVTQVALAGANSDRETGDRSENLKRAIYFLLAALEVYTREEHPQDWAMVQNNLGIAYAQLPRGGGENLERAIEHFLHALEVYTREEYPDDWAMVQNNLGTAHLKRIHGDRGDNLERAFRYFGGALEVDTRDKARLKWADLQLSLGHVFIACPRRPRREPGAGDPPHRGGPPGIHPARPSGGVGGVPERPGSGLPPAEAR